MLVPLLVVFGLIQSRGKPGEVKARVPVPWFVFGFIAVLLFNSVIKVHPQVRRLILEGDQFLFLMVMVSLGLTTSLARLREAGGAWRLIGVGLVAIMVSAGTAYGLVSLAGLNASAGASQRAAPGKHPAAGAAAASSGRTTRRDTSA